MKNFKNIIPYIFLFIVSIFSFWINISTPDPKGVINSTDYGVPFNLIEKFNVATYTWDSFKGFGYPSFRSLPQIFIYPFPWVVLIKVGFSILNTEKIYSSVILFLVGGSAYFFLTNYFKFKSEQTKIISSLLGSLFFMLNNIIGQKFIGNIHTAIPVALLPIFLLVFDRIMRADNLKKMLTHSLILSLLISISIYSDFSISYLIFITIIFFVALNIIINLKQIVYRNLICSFAIIGLLVFLLNSFWFLPIFSNFFQKSNSPAPITEILGADLNKDAFIKNTVYHNSPLDFLKLLGSKQEFEGITLTKENYYPEFIRLYYRLPFDTILFFVFIISGVVIGFKDNDNKKKLIFISSLGLLGFFFLFNTKAPLGFWNIHLWMFDKIPGFRALRSFTKWHILILFWYVCIITLISNKILSLAKNNFFKKIAYILLIVAFIGQGSLPWFIKNFAGNFEFYSFPKYYYEAKAWLDSQGNDFRFFVFPQHNWEELYDWGPKLRSVYLYDHFFNQPSLYFYQTELTGGKDFADVIENFEIGNPALYLSFLGVKYILVRKDLKTDSLSPNHKYVSENIENYLLENGFFLEKSFGDKLFFYANKQMISFPSVYIPNKIVLYNGKRDEVKYLFDLNAPESLPAIFSNEEALPEELSEVAGEKYLLPVLNKSKIGISSENSWDEILKNFEYSLDLSQSGDYQFLIRPDFKDNLLNIARNVLDENFFSFLSEGRELNAREFNNLWWNFGNINFSKGINKFSLKFPKINIITNQWLESKENDSIAVNNRVYIQYLNNWVPGISYSINFKHISNNDINFSLIEGIAESKNEFLGYKVSNKTLISDNLNSGNISQEYNKVVTAGPKSLGAAAVVTVLKTSASKVENLSIAPVFKPQIIIREVRIGNDISYPKINYQKINPTKYEVFVENADKPFALVLNERFNNNWKLENGNNLISESQHFTVNGYANGWYIGQNDLSNFGNKISIVFLPQKYFSIGIRITLFSFGIIIASVILLTIFEKKRQENEII